LLPHPVAVNILDLDVELYDDCQFRLDTVDWLKIVVCFLAPLGPPLIPFRGRSNYLSVVYNKLVIPGDMTYVVNIYL
jgi:hypothetical protein